MKMQITIFVLLINVLLLSSLKTCNASNERQKRSPSKYDDHYNKFLTRHFADLGAKYIDGKQEYKQAQAEADGEEEYDDEEEGESAKNVKDDVDNGDSYNYKSNSDYERIKALSEAQVAKLHEKPGNCKHFEKDGMICAQCLDPETGDTSESCAYSSEPHDKKVAYLTRKSHNYKNPAPVEVDEPVEVEEPVDHEEESEDQEEAPVTPSAKHPKPAKHKSEIEDAGDYSAYKLAVSNADDVDDYDDQPKFAHLKVQPAVANNDKVKKDFEILPSAEFQTKNLNQALTDFNTKDWSKCNKIMKGDMTCYYCKDAKGATQEECMFISSTNPKNIKLERHEAKKYDIDSRRPSSAISTTIVTTNAPLKVAPIVPDNREKFARMRMARPLVPTKSTFVNPAAEPLVTPKTSINPIDHHDNQPFTKKTIKRTVSHKKRFDSIDDFYPSESRVVRFETHIMHDNE